ncbi:MAG: hypothetical protein ACRD38_13050 [Nitrososphaerales archaeon]
MAKARERAKLSTKAKKRNWDKEYREAVKYWDWVFSLPKRKRDEIFYEMLEASSRGAQRNEE